ncbi:MAG: HEAT repeat domain-containing protein [Chloroflexota bacterium]
MTEQPNPNSTFQPDFDIRGLLAGLESDNAMHRQQSAAALGGMKAVEALSALQKAHLAENDEATRKVMSAAIGAIKASHDGIVTDVELETEDDSSDEETVTQLIDDLKSGNSSKIIHAAETLGEMGEKVAVGALIIAFNNPKHTIHVRLAIAEALLKLESAPVEVALLANLRHADWHIRRNGAAILGQLKADWAVEPLARTLQDPHPVVRRTALAALKHIGTPQSRRALAQNAPSDHRSSVSQQDARKQVSGIEVKRPGKPDEADDNSSLLRRLQQEREAAERARRSTQPFGADSEFAKAANLQEAARKIDSTQPIQDDMLNQLDALLDDDDEA